MPTIGSAHGALLMQYSSFKGPASLPPRELSKFLDTFLAENQESFNNGDIATPLLHLMRAALQPPGLSEQARNNWIAVNFERVVDRALLSPELSAVARASVRPLIDTFLRIASPSHTYSSRHEVRVNQETVNPESVTNAVRYLVQFHGDECKANNPIPLLYHAYFLARPDLLGDHSPATRSTLAARAYKDLGAGVSAAIPALTSFVFSAFQSVENQEILISPSQDAELCAIL